MKLGILDDGSGMDKLELIEAMRLGSKDPSSERENKDLGRFGLGLKTASFSQCKRLTTITKKNGQINARRWDLSLIEKENEWILIEPNLEEFESYNLYQRLEKQDKGTLIIWEEIDGISTDEYYESLDLLRRHLSLVFHRFLEGSIVGRKFSLDLNNNVIKPFNPFNESNMATQILPKQIIILDKKKINITPYILPHHSKLSPSDYQKYATDEGYTKSQGFYLYRGGRLLIHGTWWGLNKLSDAHRLVRIKVDITNDQDTFWNIDVKKSTANPNTIIKNELKKIMNQVLNRGERTYTKRATIIEDKTIFPFWDIFHGKEEIIFKINREHPVLYQLKQNLNEQLYLILNTYLKGVEAYLPISSIQAHMLTDPHKINQLKLISSEEKQDLFSILLSLDLSKEQLEQLLKTEIFKDVKG